MQPALEVTHCKERGVDQARLKNFTIIFMSNFVRFILIHDFRANFEVCARFGVIKGNFNSKNELLQQSKGLKHSFRVIE